MRFKYTTVTIDGEDRITFNREDIAAMWHSLEKETPVISTPVKVFLEEMEKSILDHQKKASHKQYYDY